MNAIWSIGQKRRRKLVRAEEQQKKRRNLRSTQELLVDIRAERQKGNAAGGEKQTNKQHKNNL